jgi:hypothetical protein
MNQDRYYDYLQTDVWRSKRSAAIRRDGGTCSYIGCSSRNDLQVHHRVYPKVLGTEDLSTLITLCKGHHSLLHDFAQKNRLQISEATEMFLSQRGDWKITVLPEVTRAMQMKRWKPYGKKKKRRGKIQKPHGRKQRKELG